MESGEKRNSSIEISRIFAMLLIILGHLCSHSEIITLNCESIINRTWMRACPGFAYIGVDIFAIISGYFLCTVNRIKVKHIFRIWLQMLFYSVLIYVVLCGIGYNKFSLREFVRALLPYSSSIWWYATTYITILVLAPFINKALDNLTIKRKSVLLGISIFLWSVFPSFIYADMGFSYVIWLLVLYQVGAFMRAKQSALVEKKNIMVGVSVVILMLTFAVMAGDILLGNTWGNRFTLGSAFIYIHSIFMLMSAFGFCVFFIGIPTFHNSLINITSASTFGIYLIHDNPYIRNVLWKILPTKSMIDNGFFILYTLGVTLLVFIVCFIVERIRTYSFALIERGIKRMRLYNRVIALEEKIEFKI